VARIQHFAGQCSHNAGTHNFAYMALLDDIHLMGFVRHWIGGKAHSVAAQR
jgi:hypothetical protein